MTASPGTQITPAELRALDAQYRPFPDFRSFSAAVELDTDLWERAAGGLEQKRADASADFDRAVEVALRAAAMDTGALEGEYTVDRGITMTVATQEEGWEEQVEARGERVRRLFEAQLRGYELAQDLAESEVPITEAWIRQLHAEVAKGIDTYWVLTPQGWQEQALPKGTYKHLPNHVLLQDGTKHAYAPVDRVPHEMQRLVAALRTPEFDQAHPALQAAYAQYALVVVHPFADLNGRAARALASTFLLQAQHIPLVVFADQRNEYLDALSAADRGNYQAFVDFIFDRVLDTVRTVADRRGPSLEEGMSELRSVLQAQGGLSHGELEQVGVGLFSRLGSSVQTRINNLSLPKDVSCHYFDGVGSNSIVSNEVYRQFLQHNLGSSFILFSSESPAGAHLECELHLLIAKDKAARYPFLLKRVDPLDEFPVRLTDVYPKLSDALTQRIDVWVERMLAEGLRSLAQQAEQSLRKAGY